MHDGDGVAEALDEAAGGLRRERDLRHQHDRRSPPLERRRDGAQVDLRLAAAGDAVEHDRSARPGARIQAALDLRQGGCLVRGRLGRSRARADALQLRAPRRLERVLEPHQPAPLERAQRRVIAGRAAAELGGAQRPAAQLRERGALARPEPLPARQCGLARRRERRPQRSARHERPGGARAGARRQHERQPPRGRRDVLARHPQAERDERLRHVRLQHRKRLGEPLRRQLALLGQVHDDPEQALAAERHHQHAAHARGCELTVEEVVERPAQRARRGERLDLGDHASEPTIRAGRRSAAPKRERCGRGDRLRRRGAARRPDGPAGARGPSRAAANARAGGLHARRAAPRRRRGPARVAAGRARARGGGPAPHPA